MSTEDSQEEEHYNIFFQVNNTWNGLRYYTKMLIKFHLIVYLSLWLECQSDGFSIVRICPHQWSRAKLLSKNVCHFYCLSSSLQPSSTQRLPSHFVGYICCQCLLCSILRKLAHVVFVSLLIAHILLSYEKKIYENKIYLISQILLRYVL